MLDTLPDGALYGVLGYLNIRDLCAVRQACSTLQLHGGADNLWRPLFKHRFPVDFRFAEASADRRSWSLFARSWTWMQDRWRGARAGCTQSSSTFSHQALFCLNALGDGRFACAGAEGTVRILAPTDSGGLRVSSEWDAGGVGHLGMSVDISAQTLVTCGFDGGVTLWQLNCAERDRLPTLPARRLKALLDARGVPYADLTERADFVARVRATGALPPATRLRALPGHTGAVPGASHSGDTLITGGNDGTARLWRLSTGDQHVIQAGHAGVDAVAYDAASGRAFTGDKAGVVNVYDVNRPGSSPLVSWQAEGWVWCVKPGSTYLHSEGGAEPGAPSAEAPAPLIVGSTDGFLRVADPRAAGWVRPPLQASGPVAGEEADASPIAGVAPSWSNSRVTTSAFDGSLSIWDTRTWRRLRHVQVRRSALLPYGYERLTRCDISRDRAVAASASGAAYCWYFGQDGPEDDLNKFPLDIARSGAGRHRASGGGMFGGGAGGGLW